MEAEQQQMRNLRDFLLVYNKMTEQCFTRCVQNLNYRYVTMEEEQCMDSCASKLIRSNHRLMSAYVGLMPAVVQRRMAELESQSKEVEITPGIPVSSADVSGADGAPISATVANMDTASTETADFRIV
ncbi:mitochondrial import inner membrane translocase subunit Tim10 B [Pelodytes ibericus]